MSESERWQQIKEVLHQALQRGPEARPGFLAEVCSDDESLQKEVEALLASYDRKGSFFEKPATADIAKVLADDQAEPLVGQSLGPYRVISQLGAGGMGEVYLAEDTRLHRPVALKLLAAHFTSDDERVGRFRQEAFAASSLNHPNIVTVYEIGEWQGKHFIAGEFVDGVTLRTRMRSRRLSLADALDIALQIVGALAAAHNAGIVHRDIKPENVMVRPDGLVKVLDFGIAKYTEATHTRVAREALVKTMQGAVVGTAAYMSPEQARGLAVDARTDIWSLGVILYEMSARQLPFPGATPSDRIAAILEREPVPLPKRRRKLPVELERILKRTLAKNREERYAQAADLAADLRKLRATCGAERPARFALPEPVRSLSTLPRARMLVVLFALLLVIGAAGFAVVKYVAPFRLLGGGKSTINSLAVLPFVNATADPNTEYLSDGITESLINNLSRLPHMKIMSRSSVFRYKGKETDVQTIGRELGVEAVLTGRVMQRNDELSIRIELVDARDNSHIWGEQYNRKLSDILAVQEAISREVSETLRVRLTGEEQKRLSKVATENPDAYQLYLKGRYYLSKRTDEGLKKAIEYFNQTIEKDPSYALAYSGLADSNMYIMRLGFLHGLSPKEIYLRAKSSAIKAVEIDDNLAEAHTSLALIKMEYEWDWPAAEREFSRALELNPNEAEAHHQYSHYLTAVGRTHESLVESLRAMELDPLSLPLNGHLAWHYVYARQYDQAIEQCRRTIEMDANYPQAHDFLGGAYEQTGMYEEAFTEFQKAISLSGDSVHLRAELGHAYAVAGKGGEALKIMDELKRLSKETYVSPYDVAAIYVGLGQKDQAFDWLEKAYQERSDWLRYLKVDPRLDPLRSDLRFPDLVRRVGLPQ